MNYLQAQTTSNMKYIFTSLAAWLVISILIQTQSLAETNPVLPEQWTPENAVEFALANNPDK